MFAGLFIVNTVNAWPVVVLVGRFDCGHNTSVVTSGSVRGKHIGKPVAEAIVGLSWSTMNRPSGDIARPNRPPLALVELAGSLMRTRAPVVASPSTPPTRISPVL